MKYFLIELMQEKDPRSINTARDNDGIQMWIWRHEREERKGDFMDNSRFLDT